MTSLTAEMRAAAARTAEAPQLRVGAQSHHLLPAWLQLLRRRYPGTPPVLQTNTSAQLLRGLGDGQLDVALLGEYDAGRPLSFAPGLRSRVVVEREPVFVALSERHPAAVHDTVRLQDLAEDQWAIRKQRGRLAGHVSGAARGWPHPTHDERRALSNGPARDRRRGGGAVPGNIEAQSRSRDTPSRR
ncbi:LysR substrate-binding domain-containing protein [Streptomyces sp. NPDC014006]|uniref:LysR substrate-binding domain-containing protein n=1 Tax=Streptomyces sp. NPDC014006 TaxID=3364870 RepID=UPI0036FDD3B8